MSAAKIIDRLAQVRTTGPGRWIACCPAHEDNSPSLSVRELDDGRILIHDFGGCGTDAVLDALGLEMGDLFPDGPRGEFRGTKSSVPARDVLAALSHEAYVLAVLAAKFCDTHALDEEEWSRIALCASRIGAATHAQH